MNREKLNELVDYFLSEGDLSHLQSLRDNEGRIIKDDALETVSQMFSVAEDDALTACMVAQGWLALREGNLLDMNDYRSLEAIDLWELWLDIIDEPWTDQV